jgi:hypothetical protein
VCGAIDGIIELPEDVGEVQEEAMQKQVAQLHVHGLGDPASNPLEQQEDVGKDLAQEPDSTNGEEAKGPDLKTRGTNTAAESSTPSPSRPVPQQPASAGVIHTPQSQTAPLPPPRDLVDEILFYAMAVVGLTILYLLIRRFNRSAEGGSEL